MNNSPNQSKDVDSSQDDVFTHGILEGYNLAIREIKDKSVGFKIENQHYIVPVEVIEGLGLNEHQRNDEEYLRERYKRWHTFAKFPDGTTQYVAVNHRGSSYSLTLKNGQLRTSALLAERVDDARIDLVATDGEVK